MRIGSAILVQASVAVAFFGAACSGSSRNFDGSSTGGESGHADQAAGGSGAGLGGGHPQAGSPSDAGEATGGASVGGAGGDNDAGAGGSSGAVAAAGAGGNGAVAGAGGGAVAGAGGCAAFSCCISGKAFDANAVSPLNACEACKPAKSSSSWTATDGEKCTGASAFAVHPKASTYRKEACSSYCNHTDQPMTPEVSLSLTFGGSAQNRTSSEGFLLLDYSNLIPSDSLNVSHAVLKLYASPGAPTADARSILITRVGVADASCKIPLSMSAGVALIECDVTAAVKSWLASAPANPRMLKVSTSGGPSITVNVETELATDGAQRPVLLLDYAGNCAGNVCPALTQ